MANYKFITNNNKKMTNLEFSWYVENVVKKISNKNLVVKYTFQSDQFNRYIGAIIKYI